MIVSSVSSVAESFRDCLSSFCRASLLYMFVCSFVQSENTQLLVDINLKYIELQKCLSRIDLQLWLIMLRDNILFICLHVCQL